MKRHFIYSLAATFITAALAMGSFTACSNEDIVVDQQTATQAQTYTVSIPASMGEDSKTRGVEFGNDGSSITSKFEAGDKVYVYNETQGAFACGSDGTLIPLTLTDGSISNGGKNCTLSGNLTFYKFDETDPDNPTWTPVTPGANDTYSLYYNMSNVSSDEPEYSYYDYLSQDGWASEASACDFAIKTGLTMTTSGNALEPSSTVTFESLQSMFRQRLSFTQGPNNEGSTSPTLKKLTISTKNGTLVTSYSPLRQLGKYDSKYDCYYIEINNPQITGDGDIYLSMAFDYREGHVADGDELQLEAIDTEGHVYVASKAVPTGGFTTGKYYYGSMTLAWSEQRYIKPTVTPAATPNEYWCYNIDGNGAALAYTISGTSKGYNFNISNYSSCTLTLSGLNAEYDNGSYIGAHNNKGLNIVVNGANTITSPAGYIAVGATYGELKLSGNGTLTVTSNDADWCGLKGTNYTSSNNNHSTTTSVNVSTQLAADGYTVTRSDMTNNGNSTYTWTYTVAPAYFAVTMGDIGKVIGADGKIYDNADAATAASTSAEAMIAFVGTIDGVCEHGLAISLTNAYEYNATFAEATGDVIISSWATYHPIEGGTWRLPSEADWQRMMWGYYTETPAATDISTFQTNLSAVGTALVDDAYYWTSTGVDTENAKTVLYDGTYAGIQSVAKTGYYHVRACLAF